MQFAHLPREMQRGLVFIDRRYAHNTVKSPPVPLDALPEEEVKAHAGPLHFIFHSGFCASTLLARALDAPGVSMGLKEPAIITSIARTWLRGGDVEQALALALDLLSRPLTPGEVQIIKPSNAANGLATMLMRLRPDAKALVLFSPLPDFLAALARRGMQGRAMGRQFFVGFAPIAFETGFSTEELELQTDLQIAAQAWLRQMAFLNQLARDLGPQRARLLSCDTLLRRREAAFASVSQFFDLEFNAEAIGDICGGPAFREHAKRPGLLFEEAAYWRSQHATTALFRSEIDAADAWAADLAARCRLDISLQETLLAA